MSTAARVHDRTRTTGPFDSIRELIAAHERRGKLLRIPEVDQDRFEATAFMYRLLDRFGFEQAPAVRFDRVRIGGRWFEGPVVTNLYGGWDDEAIPFGVPIDSNDQLALYHAVIQALLARLDPSGQWPRIPPREIDRSTAPCKQVVLAGEAADLEQFPWFKNLPADGGRYINQGAVVLDHPDFGKNLGTYRAMVSGPRTLGLNPEPGQHGWRILMAARRAGETRIPVAIACSTDTITMCVSSTKLAAFGEDELEIAGGLRGRPVDVVRCETSALRVPAFAEMIIEGDVHLDEAAPEGPYGEMFGYLGPRKEANFVVHVAAITHRENPVFVNSFTGLTADIPKAPTSASEFQRYRPSIPGLVGILGPRGAQGLVVVAIDKRMPGEGMAAGLQVAANPSLSKVVVVVDKDIDITDPRRVLHALGARWQPAASLLIPQTQAFLPDPSMARRGVTSKIVIDATRQLPDEGGPSAWPPANRTILEEQAPEAFRLVDAKWAQYFAEP